MIKYDEALVRYGQQAPQLNWREVHTYGCTVAEMREAVEESLTFRFSGPVMCAMSLMSDCQEMLAHGNGQLGISGSPEITPRVSDEIRQTLNRAKWILSTYATESRGAARAL